MHGVGHQHDEQEAQAREDQALERAEAEAERAIDRAEDRFAVREPIDLATARPTK